MRSIHRCFILCLVLAGCGSRQSSEPILIGHLAPQSGPEKEIGEQETQGLVLAVESANQQEEKVAGRSVAVLHADTRGSLDLIQPMAVRLIAVNRVAALLGGADAAQAERLNQVAQQYQIPLLTTSGLPASQIGSFVFPVGIAPEEQGKILARFMAQELKADRAAVLSDGSRTDSVALASAFAKEFRKIGSVPADEFPFQKEAELPDLAKQITAAKPKAILVAAGADVLRAIKWDTKIPLVFGGDEVTDKTLTPNVAPEQVIYRATAFVSNGQVPSAREFEKTYQERFGRAPDVHAVLANDSARILFEAVRQAKSWNSSKVKEQLEKLGTFESLTGPLSFRPDHSVRRAVFIVRLEKGQPKLVKRYDPEAQ